jgi:hypothetical protein
MKPLALAAALALAAFPVAGRARWLPELLQRLN